MIQTQTEILLTSLSGHRMLFGDWKTAYLVAGKLFPEAQFRRRPDSYTLQIMQGTLGVIAEMEKVSE
jgi:hypothetical protein